MLIFSWQPIIFIPVYTLILHVKFSWITICCVPISLTAWKVWQSGKIRTRKTPNTDISHVVPVIPGSQICHAYPQSKVILSQYFLVQIIFDQSILCNRFFVLMWLTFSASYTTNLIGHLTTMFIIEKFDLKVSRNCLIK